MSLNLLDLVKDQVTGALVKQASGFLGESESGIAKALGGIMPTLLGSTIEKAAKPEGAGGLMDLIGGLDLDGLGDIAGLFGGGQEKVNGLMNSGGGILDMLMGNKTSGIVDLIAGMAGLKSSTSSSLLKMAAPLLMGLIGKQIKGKGLGALTDLLMGQKSHVANALPSGVGSLLGLSSLGNLGNAAKSAANEVTETAGGGMGWLKWALPLLLIAGLGWWWSNGNSAKKAAEEMAAKAQMQADSLKSAAEEAAKMAASAANAVKAAFSKVDAAAKAELDKIKLTEGSAPAQMKAYIDGGLNGDPMFYFKNMNFASGSAKLSKEAEMEADQVAAILKAYPEVKIAIHGHTDNTGDAAKNLQLSKERAAAVMGRLMGKGGIAATRLTSEGFGDTKPVGDNATDEGKAKKQKN